MRKLIDQYIETLFSNYSKFDKLSQSYVLKIDSIPCFDIHELVALLIQEDESLAHEATGPDNPEYEKTMLPALLRYMKNSTNRDEEIEFNKTWRDGVASYFKVIIQELIDKHCDDYLRDEDNYYSSFNREFSTEWRHAS